MKKDWDSYFLNLCNAVASNSKCLSRQIGAVIVKDGKYIVSTGYNGPSSGVKHCGEQLEWISKDPYNDPKMTYSTDITFLFSRFYTECPRQAREYESGKGLHLCPAAHAERNAIDIAARLGHSTEGCSLYLNCLIPCMECAKSIINAGIKEVIVTELKDYEKEGITGLQLLREAGIIVRTYQTE